jgi:hypothetical protein
VSQVEGQRLIVINKVPLPVVLDDPVPPVFIRTRIVVGNVDVMESFAEKRTETVKFPSPSPVVEAAIYSEGVQRAHSAVFTMPPVKVFESGPKPSSAVGCHGYNPTEAPPVKVSTVPQAASVPIEERE